MKNNNVLLAFSGGLDTTYCAIYLKKKLGLDVHAITIDTGGFTEDDRENLEEHAKQLGFKSFKIIDATGDYYKKIIKYLIYGNVLKNNTYPLSVSAERIIQALAITETAKKMQVNKIAHGSTGAGNDQIRFDMAIKTILPECEIITPIRDLKLSRQDEINYLKEHQIIMNYEKSLYSINKGIWGNSVGGKETLVSNLPLPQKAWPTPITKNEPEKLTITFTKGEVSAVNGRIFDNPVNAITLINQIASAYGVGRDIHVGDTIIGIKGRVGFEAAAAILIIKAHHTLEKHTLTKWQLYWKDQLSLWYGNWLHEGQYLDPVMRDIETFFENTQSKVNGTVSVLLNPNWYSIEGVESPNDLMNNKFGSYGEMNKGYTADDVKGFTRIFGNQTAIYYAVNNGEIS